MFIIRTIFYLIIAYFVSKLLRVFFEPSTLSNTPKNRNTNFKPEPQEAPRKESPKSKLGEYVEFEEVKA
jgi:hypothetical protein